MAGTIQDVSPSGYEDEYVSMESGLDGRNNEYDLRLDAIENALSQWSPA